MFSATRKRPISHHPAFRWAVGVWFAALFGGALFVMPDAVHAGLRQTAGIDDVIPAGFMSRIAISTVAALIGLLLGLVIAGRVAGSRKTTMAMFTGEGHPDTELWLSDELEAAVDEGESLAEELPRRPFSPREQLDDAGIAYPRDSEPDRPASSDSDAVAFGIDDFLPDGFAARSGARQNGGPEEAGPPEIVGSRTRPGDLSLAELTEQLRRAIAAHRAAEAAVPDQLDDSVDPVIAFLRREANRISPRQSEAPASNVDSQEVLRGALDRLTEVSKFR